MRARVLTARIALGEIEMFSTRSKWRPNSEILPGNISSVPTFKKLDSHKEKVTIERRREKLELRLIDHMTLTV